MMSTLTKEQEQKIDVMTEEILSGKAKLIDLTAFKTEDYIKCKGQQIECIEGKWRLAFVRCPKCRKFISIYKNEISSDGRTKIMKKCLCGFKKIIELKNWNKK